MNSKKSITFIGAGNVATHLAKSFFSKGLSISKVYSKNIENARLLAQAINAKPCNSLDNLYEQNHIYFVCVKDDVIEEVISQLSIQNNLVVHTSGSVGIDVFVNKNINNYGIFYPLQTFSKDKTVNISEVPFCIEGNNSATENELVDLAKCLSNNVQLINSEQRKHLHLAAVFACNFSNYMYAIADDLLQQNNLDLNLLKPLITETANKIKDNPPKAMQTGPAKRNDQEVIKKQLEMLANKPEYKELYQLITNNIIKTTNGKF